MPYTCLAEFLQPTAVITVLGVPTCAACSVAFTHSYHSPGIVSSTAESLTVELHRQDEEFLTVQNSVHRDRDRVNV